jgi:carbonic anhydrase
MDSRFTGPPNQSRQVRQGLASDLSLLRVILGCVGWRVPPEIVFDQGLEDMFVTRSVEQVIDNAVLWSVEFADEKVAKLIVVLGHQNCGAGKATIQIIEQAVMPIDISRP